MTSRKPRILLTGAGGFIGRHAARALAEAGCEVHAPSRQARPLSESGVIWRTHDLLRDDPDALIAATAPDVLLHAAWETSHGAFWASPANLDWLAATCRLARAFAQGGGRRMVGVGTVFEYDAAAVQGPIAEDAPLRPETLYAATKDAGRRALQVFATAEGLSFAWARLFHLYGPDEDPRRLVPAVAAAIRAGQRPVAMGPGLLRDYMHAKDAGHALARIALSEGEGAFNVATGQPVSIGAVIAAIADALGRPDAAPDERPARPQDPPSLVADITRLRALGFAPRSLAQGLSEVLSVR